MREKGKANRIQKRYDEGGIKDKKQKVAMGVGSKATVQRAELKK